MSEQAAALLRQLLSDGWEIAVPFTGATQRYRAKALDPRAPTSRGFSYQTEMGPRVKPGLVGELLRAQMLTPSVGAFGLPEGDYWRANSRATAWAAAQPKGDSDE